MISDKIKQYFDNTIDIVYAVILIFIILAIIVGAGQLFVTTWELFAFNGITGHYIDLISDVLTLYVLTELSRSLVDYFHTHRLRLTFIVDAAFVFVLREVLIDLFKHNIQSGMIYAFALLLLVLGIIRIGSILVYEKELKIQE